MKKLICIVLASVTMVFSFSIQSSAASYRVGDVTQDNNINIHDVTQIQKYLVESANINTCLADFDGNGRISIVDSTLLQKYLAGIVYQYNGFLYTSDAKKGTIIAYNGASTTLKIPSGISDTIIIAIADSAFKDNKKITSVSIPLSVVSIGYYAFQNCTALEKVIIRNVNCHIDSSSFDGCTKLSYFVQG